MSTQSTTPSSVENKTSTRKMKREAKDARKAQAKHDEEEARKARIAREREASRLIWQAWLDEPEETEEEKWFKTLDKNRYADPIEQELYEQTNQLLRENGYTERDELEASGYAWGNRCLC